MAGQFTNPLRALGRGRAGRGLEWGKRAADTGPPATGLPPRATEAASDLEPRRQRLAARVAELQWDLGGLAYEMAIRDHVRVDVLVARAAELQAADAELAEVERVMRMEQSGASGSCPSCDALHSRGAAYCWQCGQPLVAQVRGEAIAGRPLR